ncbi:MAG: response regulator [Acidobacteria bacterium]|jgi:signal transduction histidine kinase/CheY-like chemotaxis protein|nr:response regulator [Acidobacteriota bacterium]
MTDSDQPTFLTGGGRMGALMRAHDWSTSSLGHPDQWPQSLRTAVRIMLNTGHPMYVFWGPDLSCLYNDAYSESIGPERHPVSLGQPARQVWDEIWTIIGPQVDQVMSGRGATWNVNHLVPITRHGRRENVYWTYSYSPIDDDTSPSGVGGVLVVCTETTDQVLTARRLAAERDRLAQLFEQAPTFMTMLSGPDHRFEFVNPAYLQLVGHRSVVGRTVAEALPEVVDQGYIALLDTVRHSGKAYTATGARISLELEPGGPVCDRFVDFVYQPIKDEAGSVTGIFVLGADVTDRSLGEVALRESEAALREADKRKDEFLAVLAHELRNPLAPILTGLELIRLSGDSPGTVARVRATMERQVGHMVRLIDDLLDVSRITAGKIELQRVPAKLHELIQGAVDANRAALSSKQISLKVDLPDDVVVLNVDVTRFVQTVSNLLHNANKFTPAGGWVHLSARVVPSVEPPVISIRVADSGIGMSPELLPRVFELFTQGRLASGEPGLGIGLALVRRLVEMHGGTVTARSDGPGHGSEFEILLPLAASAAVPVPADDDTQRIHRRVVIIDDNTDAANMMALLIESLGGNARVAYDGDQGIREVQAHGAEVVLLDIGMQPLDGYETCRRLRDLVGSDVVIVALTGWGQSQDKDKAEAAGFNAHLTKPADLAALRALLASAPSD